MLNIWIFIFIILTISFIYYIILIINNVFIYINSYIYLIDFNKPKNCNFLNYILSKYSIYSIIYNNINSIFTIFTNYWIIIQK